VEGNTAVCRKKKPRTPSSPHPWEFFPSPQYSHSAALPWLMSKHNCTWAMGWGVQISNPDRGKIFFSSSIRPDRLWATPRFLLNWYRGFSGGVNLPGRQVNHSSSYCAEVKRECSCTSAPPIHLHGFSVQNITFLLPLDLSIMHLF
jgi:hypothetical protein